MPFTIRLLIANMWANNIKLTADKTVNTSTSCAEDILLARPTSPPASHAATHPSVHPWSASSIEKRQCSGDFSVVLATKSSPSWVACIDLNEYNKGKLDPIAIYSIWISMQMWTYNWVNKSRVCIWFSCEIYASQQSSVLRCRILLTSSSFCPVRRPFECRFGSGPCISISYSFAYHPPSENHCVLPSRPGVVGT